MSETPSEEQGTPAVEPPEAQRNWSSFLEGAAAAKLLDQVVPDAYGAVKAAGKQAWERIHDRGPEAEVTKEADPPAGDVPS